MEKIKVIYDQEGNSLTVWFADPSLEHICEETGEEVILVKDKAGQIIGFEKLNFLKSPGKVDKLEVESAIS